MSNKSDEKTISQKIEELENLVGWFESDDFVIEKSIEQYKKAENLAAEIESELDGLKNEVTVLKRRFDKDQ